MGDNSRHSRERLLSGGAKGLDDYGAMRHHGGRKQTMREVAMSALVSGPSASMNFSASLTPSSSCVAFGTVFFPTVDSSAQFAVIELQSSRSQAMRDVVKRDVLPLFQQTLWNITPKKPELLFTVNSGPLTISMTSSERRDLMQALIDACNDARAWIFTDGTDSGTMQLVGEARMNYGCTVPAIGMTLLDRVPRMMDRVPAELREQCACHLHVNYYDSDSTWVPPGYRELEQYHSHFILARTPDNTDHDAFRFRLAVEDELAMQFGCRSICLVIEGDVSFYWEAETFLTRKTPLIILLGSGGAADVLGRAAQHWQDWREDNSICTGLHSTRADAERDCPFIVSLIQDHWDVARPGQRLDPLNLSEYFKFVSRCAQMSDLISIISLGDEPESSSVNRFTKLKEAVLEACIKQIRAKAPPGASSLSRQLKLAISWNRADVAANTIFKPFRQEKRRQRTQAAAVKPVSETGRFFRPPPPPPKEPKFLRILRFAGMRVIWANRIIGCFRNAAKEAALRREAEIRHLQCLQYALLFALRGGSSDFVELLWDEGADLPAMFDINIRIDSAEDASWLSRAEYADGSTVYQVDELDLSNLTHSELTTLKPRNNEMLLRLFSPIFDPAQPPLEGGGWKDLATKSQTGLPFEENSPLMQTWVKIWEPSLGRVETMPSKRLTQEEAVRRYVGTVIGNGFCYQWGALGPMFDLMVWAIFFNVGDLPFFFWKHTKEPLFAAIAGAALCSRIANHPDTSISRVQRYSEGALRFEAAATSLLVLARSASLLTSTTMLERRWWIWGYKSVLDIAIENGCNSFISRNEATCLKCLSGRWTAGLLPSPRLLPLPMMFQMLLALIFPPLTRYLSCQNLWVFFVLKSFNELGKTLFVCEKNAITEKDEPVDFIQPLTFVPTERQRISIFYQSPLTQFLAKTLFYIAFLALYTLMVTRPLNGPISHFEIGVALWVFTFVVELFMEAGQGLKQRLTEVWHQLDLASYLLFCAGMICRGVGQDYAGKTCYSIGGILFYVRMLNVLSVHPKLGPLITILGRMISDIGSFFTLFFIVVFAFGIAFKGLLIQSDPTGEAANDAIARVYFNLYGKLFLSTLEGEPAIVEVLLAVYMVVAVILLLTLLVAMLTSTYELIRVSSNTVWLSQYHAAIIEIKKSSGLLPPPLSLFHRLFLFILWAIAQIKGSFENRQFKSSRERKAAQLFDQLDVFKAGRLYRVQLQQIVDGMTKLPSKPPSYVTSLVEHLRLSESQVQWIDRNEFVEAVNCWISDVGLNPTEMLTSLLTSMRLFETRWERSDRRRVSEFEVQIRTKGFEQGMFDSKVENTEE